MSYNSNALMSWKSNKAVLCLLFVVQLQASAFAQVNTKLAKSNDTGTMVSFKGGSGDFPLVSGGSAAVFYIEQDLTQGLKRTIEDVRKDISLVAGIAPKSTDRLQGKHLIIAGVIGQHTAIDKLIRNGKLNVKGIAGTWENHIIQRVANPFPGVDDALIIAGSDKRGTIYGLYTLSDQIGVSPWHWWADVPVAKHKNIYIHSGRFTMGSPAVKYRGIFLNDEAPALSGWAAEKFGGFNHKFYTKVFELLLRLKGNYLWPAMWGNAFYADDPENARLANEYGVVIGTSHHEPLMRAHDEWRRFGKGAWNYNTNAQNLQNFWKEGISRMGSNESIVTVGMRGDGDEPMSEESNISLLEKIVSDQRNIIQTVTKKPAAETPQLWALYKEVQDYYDRGMRVPEDVTLLLCDDNWGNIRKLPALDAAARKGGYGIYYHYDYVGGPRNYKWINTNPISKTWEQMHLAYQYNAKQIWIVNVGDLKPMEFPISFFLDYAWNPEKLPADKLEDYTVAWASKQFGAQYAPEIGTILSAYSKYNGRRKPELLNEKTYSLTSYSEFEGVTSEYNKLLQKAELLGKKLPPQYQDAYYQLVLHPVQASSNLYNLYFAVAKNHRYARENRVSTNDEAAAARRFYAKDAQITRYYNDTLANGKWAHLMDQTHIGYTYWQQPDSNKIPELKTVTPLERPTMGMSISGTANQLPEFNKYSNRKQYIELYNKGTGAFNYTIESAAPYLKFSAPKGRVSKETRVWLSVDWSKVPAGDLLIPITIKSDGETLKLNASIKNYPANIRGFIPDDGIISIEAANFTTKKAGTTADWKILPGFGKTESAVTPFPVTAKAQTPGAVGSPVLEYGINTADAGRLKVAAYLAPTLNFQNDKSLKYAVSIDNDKPQLININPEKPGRSWDKNVADNINIQTTLHQVKTAGPHTVKIWMVDPGIVLEKLVISPENYVEQTYLGPPESAFVK
jgi:hypothetical protein